MKKNLFFNCLFTLFLIFGFRSFAQVPVANFSVSTVTVCAGSTITVTDMSTNTPTAWSYTFSGGAPATSTVQNPSVSFAAAGIHTITLIATNGSGSSTPKTLTISVSPSPVAFINPALQNMCPGAGPLTFSVFTAGPGGPLTYSWTTGATTASISVNPSVTTSYSVVCSNSVGCSVVRTCTANVFPANNPTITSNPLSLCPGSNATLTAFGSGPGPMTYTWSTGTNSASITTSLTGVYSVTVVNSNGCKGTKSYTLGSSPSLSISVFSNPPSASICAGGTATLIATGAANYTWSSGPTTSVTIVTPSVTTSYSVLGTSGTCTGSAVMTITVNTTPTVTASSSSPTICAGKSATLTGTGATTYTWNPGAMVGAVVVVTPTASTVYACTGANGGCTNTKTISVNVAPSPTLNAASSSTLLCAGQTATVSSAGSGPGPLTYSWSTGATTSSIVITPSITSSYTLVGTNGIGCSKTVVVTQSVSACTGIEQVNQNSIVSGIYPNPNNGEFTISVKQLTDNTSVEIYNSIGQLVNRTPLKEFSTKISLSKEANGIYIVTVMHDGKAVYRSKMIKE